MRGYHSEIMFLPTYPTSGGRPGTGELCIGFTESKITKVLTCGNRSVSEMLLAVND